jgi:hypothetical protein
MDRGLTQPITENEDAKAGIEQIVGFLLSDHPDAYAPGFHRI